MRGFPDRWEASWPHDRTALVNAIAVAAAFPEFVGPLRVRLTGSANAALSGLVTDLGAAGLSEDRLPDVSLDPATTAGDGPHISLFAHALAAACEYERRPWLPVFDAADERRDAVWRLAAQALDTGEAEHVTVLTDTLDGARDLPPGRVTIVTGCPAARREARRRSMSAAPRPPSSRHLPNASLLVIDARRPDDLALAGGAQIPAASVNHDHLTTLALGAFAATAVSRCPTGLVLS